LKEGLNQTATLQINAQLHGEGMHALKQSIVDVRVLDCRCKQNADFRMVWWGGGGGCKQNADESEAALIEHDLIPRDFTFHNTP
jgi:hypothetical protein